jgi:flagellin-like protein
MKLSKLKNRKAISPVIATVILVAVAITVAVAVAYWMGGIASQYTQFEKCEVQTAICTLDTFGNWKVEVKLKNSGSKTSTLTNVFVNDVEVSAYDAVVPTAAVSTITTDMTITTPFSIKSGADDIITVWIGLNYESLSSGTTINIKIHSAGGMDYIKLVQLV